MASDDGWKAIVHYTKFKGERKMKILIEFDTGKTKEVNMLEAYIRYSLKMFNIKSIKFIEEKNGKN